MLSSLYEQGLRLVQGQVGYEPVKSNQAEGDEAGRRGKFNNPRPKSDSEELSALMPATTASSPRSHYRKTRASSLNSPEEATVVDEPEEPQSGSTASLSSIGSGDVPNQPIVILGPGIPTSASSAILSVGGFEPPVANVTMKQHASDFNLQTHLNDLQQRTALHVQTRFPMLSAPFWACFAYSLVSTSMVLVNKLLLSTYKFRFPMVLLFHQNMMTVNSLYVAKELGVTTYEPLERGKVLKWLPMDIFFVLMLLTGFYSVQLLSVPMITIFKNTNNIFIAFGDALVFKNIPSQGVVWTMILMLLAAVMAGLNDLEYTYDGYIWTLANCLASTMFVLYAQTAIAKTNLSTFGKVYYNNVLALPLVLVADVFVFGDFQKLFTASREELLTFFTLDFITLWFVSGVLGFLQSLSSLRAQHLTSPTTYSMVGSLNKIPLTFLGVWIFHSPMNAKSVLYVSLSIVAGGLYSYTKAKEDISARAAAQQAALKNAQLNQAPTGTVGRGDEAGGGAHLRPHAAQHHLLAQAMLNNQLQQQQLQQQQQQQQQRLQASRGVKSKSTPTPQVDEKEIYAETRGK